MSLCRQRGAVASCSSCLWQAARFVIFVDVAHVVQQYIAQITVSGSGKYCMQDDWVKGETIEQLPVPTVLYTDNQWIHDLLHHAFVLVWT